MIKLPDPGESPLSASTAEKALSGFSHPYERLLSLLGFSFWAPNFIAFIDIPSNI
jgi:hypothetical protein